MALNVFTAEEGPWPGPSWSADTYEAEDGVLHDIGYEASNAGFSGWGYLAGWNADGQWVDFHPTVATRGTYRVTLRYAAGAGQASRYLYANGSGVVANLAFPATASWSSYANVSADVNLNAGVNTVSVIFNSSMGSSSYLNLDAMTVEPRPTCDSGSLPVRSPLANRGGGPLLGAFALLVAGRRCDELPGGHRWRPGLQHVRYVLRARRWRWERIDGLWRPRPVAPPRQARPRTSSAGPRSHRPWGRSRPTEAPPPPRRFSVGEPRLER